MTMKRTVFSLLTLVVVAAHLPSRAAQSRHDDIASTDSTNTIAITFRCRVDYVGHTPPLAGRTLRVRLEPGDDCDMTFPDNSSAIPIRGPATQNVQSVDVRAAGGGSGVLTVRFSEPTRFSVRDDDADSVVIETQTLQHDIAAEFDNARQLGNSPATLSEERVQALLAEAKQRFIEGDHERTIQIYTRLLEEPDAGHHAQALEYLGVAHEHNGMLAQAVADYRLYIDRFGDLETAPRVEQRLAALLTADIGNDVPASTASDWNVYGGFHQEYVRYANREQTDAPDRLMHNGVLTFADLVVGHRGERFDWQTRFNSGFHKDLLEAGDGPGDQALISNGYLEVADQALHWRARIGRQTVFTDGILGRFDGIRASYRYRPKVTLNITSGFPVDSPRHIADTRRPFVGASAHLSNVRGKWDFAAHSLLQRHGDVVDRESVGGEARFHHGRWFALARVDYDAGYNVANSVLALGSVTLTDRVRINARYNLHAYPFLTTTNALIGQPTTSIDELLDLYTEAQLRTIARDRTAQAVNASVGMTATLSQNWYFNGRAGLMTIESSRASADVAARPDTGPQIHYSANFVGSSIVKAGDTTTLGYRMSSTRAADTSTLIVDTRLPFFDVLRINPRLALSWRETTTTRQLIVNPALRIGYRWRQRYRIEVETGGRWSSESLPAAIVGTPLYPDDTEQTFGSYIHFRWGADY